MRYREMTLQGYPALQRMFNIIKERELYKLVIFFYNVGHGNCTHIITPKNQHILVDIGSLEEHSISKYLKKSGIESIDMLHITHPHKDHLYDLPSLKEVGLLPRVLSRDERAFPVTNLCPRFHEDIKLLHLLPEWKIQQTANDYFYNIYTMPLLWNSNLCNPQYNGEVTIKIDFPPDKYINPIDQNSYSSLISIEYCGFKLLLTGDNNKDILKERILDDKVKKNSFTDFIMNHHVLLAPHHGRVTDFCKEFFDLVNPYLTVVSDKNIEYDSQETTSDVYNNNSKEGLVVNGMERKVLTTRKDGTIKLTIDENGKDCINTGIEVSLYGWDD